MLTRTLRLAASCCLSLFFLHAGDANAQIARIDLDGAIDPITAEFVVNGIKRAESENAQFLLIRLQTPGGFGSSME